MSAIADRREALTRLAPPSYFCTCWKVRPSALARVSWFIPSSKRRIRIRAPTCTSIGFGTPVPRPYLGVELGSSNPFDDFFNLRSPSHRLSARLQRLYTKRKQHSTNAGIGCHSINLRSKRVACYG